MARQYEAIEGGTIDLSLVAVRLKELKSQKDTLQEEISYYESLNTQNQPVHISKSIIERYRKEMEEIFMGTNVQEQRDFLKKFIEKIIVNPVRNKTPEVSAAPSVRISNGVKDEGIEIVYYMPQR